MSLKKGHYHCLGKGKGARLVSAGEKGLDPSKGSRKNKKKSEVLTHKIRKRNRK